MTLAHIAGVSCAIIMVAMPEGAAEESISKERLFQIIEEIPHVNDANNFGRIGQIFGITFGPVRCGNGCSVRPENKPKWLWSFSLPIDPDRRITALTFMVDDRVICIRVPEIETQLGVYLETYDVGAPPAWAQIRQPFNNFDFAKYKRDGGGASTHVKGIEYVFWVLGKECVQGITIDW